MQSPRRRDPAPPFLNGPPVAAPVADEKGKPEGGEYEFKLPDFDEDTFIHREIVSFKTTAILVGWAIVAAAASWALFAALGGNTASGWLAGLAVCGAFGYGLKFLFPKLGADISHFKRREWFSTGSMFFMAWLAFFIVAINPPVSDFSPPHVELSADPPLQAAGGNVTLHVLASDNAGAEVPAVTLVRDGTALPVELKPTDHAGHYEARLEGAQAGRYTLRAVADDGRHSTAASLDFSVGGDPFTVEGRGRLDSLADRIVVRLPKDVPAALHACAPEDVQKARPCLRAVRLVPTDGQGGNVTLEPKEGFWVADANHAGWHDGENHVRLEAEFLDHFVGASLVDGGRFQSPQQTTVNVTASRGSFEPTVLPDPVVRPLRVPAPAGLLVAAVLLGAAAVARRRD